MSRSHHVYYAAPVPGAPPDSSRTAELLRRRWAGARHLALT